MNSLEPGLDEAKRRVEAFKDVACIRVHIGRMPTDAELAFAQELVDAQLRLLNSGVR